MNHTQIGDPMMTLQEKEKKMVMWDNIEQKQARRFLTETNADLQALTET
jgi:hypothetical protein